MFDSNKPEELGHKEYVKRWGGKMRSAYSMARKHSASMSAKGKKQHDKKATYSTLEPGDRVLVRNLTERGGPGKLRSHWEDVIHIVVDRKPDSPVYEVKPETGNGRHRVLHRNLLLPCDFLPLTPPPLPRNKQLKEKANKRHDPQPMQEQHASDSEDGETPTYILRKECPGRAQKQNHNTPETLSANDPPDTLSANDPPEALSANDPPEALSANDPPETLSANNPPETLPSNNQREPSSISGSEVPPEPRRSTRMRRPPETFNYYDFENPGCIPIGIANVQATQPFSMCFPPSWAVSPATPTYWLYPPTPCHQASVSPPYNVFYPPPWNINLPPHQPY